MWGQGEREAIRVCEEAWSAGIDTKIQLVIIVIGWAQSANEALLCVKAINAVPKNKT